MPGYRIEIWFAEYWIFTCHVAGRIKAIRTAKRAAVEYGAKSRAVCDTGDVVVEIPPPSTEEVER